MDSKILFSIDAILGSYNKNSRYVCDPQNNAMNNALSLSNSFSSTSSSGSPKTSGCGTMKLKKTDQSLEKSSHPIDLKNHTTPLFSPDAYTQKKENMVLVADEPEDLPKYKNNFSDIIDKTETRLNPHNFEDNEVNFESYSPNKYSTMDLRFGKYKSMMSQGLVGRSPRVPFTRNQVNLLESKFKSTHYLSSLEVTELAHLLQLTETRVKIWFQNRRARERRENAVRALNETDATTDSNVPSANIHPFTGINPVSLPSSTSTSNCLLNALVQSSECQTLMNFEKFLWPNVHARLSPDRLKSSLVEPSLGGNGPQLQIEDEKV